MALIFNSQQISANGTANSFSLIQTVNSSNSILVIVNGLVQIPDADYVIINSNTVNLAITPFNNTDIEIRYIENDGVGYQGSAGYKGSSGDTGYSGSVGDLGSVGYQGSAGEPGIPGGPTGYSGSIGYTGSRGEGYTGSSGLVGKPTKSSRYVSNGSNTVYTLSDYTADAENILLFINGILESPNVDYTVSGTTLTLSYAPPLNAEIEVRYFDIAIGSPGFTGSVGYQGSFGETGYQGSLGTTGYQGSVGERGQQGPAGGQDGYTGSSGDLGYTGSIGFTGSEGVGRPSKTSRYIANGSNTQFTLLDPTDDPSHIFVFTNGILETPVIDYTTTGDFIIFNNAPQSGSEIEVRYFGTTIGAVGYRGSAGYQGSAGFTGSTGITGYIGSQGFVGSQGELGYSGSQGIQGTKGDQGIPGGFGGASFNYQFNTSTVNSDPSAGHLRLSNTVFTQASHFYINENDVYYDSTYSFLQTIDDSTSAIKGHFTITEVANVDNFALFSIVGNLTYTPNYFDVPIAFLSGTATSFNNNSYVTITFARTGDRGDTGYTGSEGYYGSVGYTGSQGEVGYIGSQGIVGYTGSLGYTGSFGYTGSYGNTGYTGSLGYTGSQGEIGYTGSKGYTGSTGYTGSQGIVGFTGSLGDTGYTGSQGVIGYTGSQGEIGYTGSQGYTGSTGYSGSFGNTGYTGSQGDIGYTGSYGDTGFTGSQGIQGDQGNIGPLGYTGSLGFTGSQGVIGYTGSQGEIGFTGSQGEVGYWGSAGYSGSYGDLGYTGSLGPIGYSGSLGEIGFTGSYGDIGPSGPQGEVGFTGSYGDLGYTGSTGAGFTGSQGEIGFTGSQGDLGYTGSSGYTGSNGFTGSRGLEGQPGSFAGFNYVFTFSANTVEANPGQGGIRFSNTVFNDANYVYVNKNALDSTYIFNSLLIIDGSTSGIKGHFKLTSTTNTQNYALFAIIDNLTDNATWVKVPIGFLTGDSNIPDATLSVLTLARTGDRGDVGYAGSTGAAGGYGYTGSLGYTGSQGIIGFTGSYGNLGYTGSQGAGFTGSYGDLGFTGSYGDLGYTGSEGAGYTGSRGPAPWNLPATEYGNGLYYYEGDAVIYQGGYYYRTGNYGNPGYAPTPGSINASWTPVADRGDLGYTGSEGAGYTGSQGETGYVGSQGLANVVVSSSVPGYNWDGLLWLDSETGILSIYYQPEDVWLGITAGGPPGEIGYTGSQGPPEGYTGSQGAGYTGSQGELGYFGSIGYTGSQGAGYTGSGGLTGFTGSIGGIGYTGSQGETGYTGSEGYTGSVGYTGSQGVVGYTGSQALISGSNFGLRKTVQQSIANNNWTKITFNTTDFDFKSEISSSVFTPTANGYYQLEGFASFSGLTNSNTGTVSIAIYKNGSAFRNGMKVPAYGTSIAVSISEMVYANTATGDYYELFVYQNASSGFQLTDNSPLASQPRFSGRFIRS